VSAAGGGHAWLDSEQLDQDTERSLPSPSSYAGLLLGLRSISTPPTPSAVTELEIARADQIAHQISLVPPPANPAAPNPSSCPPFSVAADKMQPSLSR
jgi:hypothetical protein